MASNNTARASSLKLSDDELDELYLKEIDSVTKILENMPKNDLLLSICARWLKIFEKAKPKEKFARNYMLLLMHHQLNEGDTLSFPFTDVITLHEMSTSLKGGKTLYNDSSSSSKYNTQNTSSLSSLNFQEIENTNKKLIEENNLLTLELQALKSEKKMLLQRQWDCKEEMKIMQAKRTIYARERSYIKYIFSCSIVTSLKLFDPTHMPPLTKEPIYFKTLFKVICEDEKDKAKIEELDQRFGKLLRGSIAHNLRKSIIPQLEKEYDKEKEKAVKHYKEVIKQKEEMHLELLTQKSKQYFTRLRNLFDENFGGSTHLRKKVLDFLQQYIEE